jgi:hypothetical protein
MLLLMLLQLLLPHNSIAHTMPCSPTVLGCAAQLVNMARHSSNEFATFGQPSVNKNNCCNTMPTAHKPHHMHSNTITHQQE